MIFPVSLITETVEILKAKGASFRRPADLWPRATRLRTKLDYLREFAEWERGSLNNLQFAAWLGARYARRATNRTAAAQVFPGRPEVFLQHDADRNPENTIAVMRAERSLGVVSTGYFFRNRASRWDGDVEPYELDIEAMQQLEKEGFEIGYHLNGPELEHYDLARGWERIRSDVAFFRSRFNLRSFVPHGGRRGPMGEDNHIIEHTDCLEGLIWFYNGRGVVPHLTWSDGELECPDSSSLADPREVARRINGRMRVRFLFHPQYYGPHLRPNLKNVGVTQTSWWKDLWEATAV